MSVRSSLAWMAASQSSLFVLQFVVSVLMARILGPYEMGVFAIAMSVVGMLSIIRMLGLGGYLVREQELTRPLLATVFTINAGLAVLAALAIVGLSLLGEALLQEPGVRRLLLVLAIVPLLSILDLVPTAFIERRGDFRVVAVINVVRFGISGLCTLGFAYAGAGYMSPGYGHLISAVAGTALSTWFGRDGITLRLGLQGWRNVTRFGMQMLSLSAILSIQGQLADFVLARCLGLPALGVFSRSNSLTGVLWGYVQAIFVRVFFVEFSALRRQGRPLRDSYLLLLETLTGLLWPAFLGMAIVSGPLVVTLYGDRWVDAALPLSLLSMASAVFVLIMVAGDVFIIGNETGLQTKIEVIRAPCSLALFTAGCLVSLEAAAAAKIIEAAAMVVAYHRPLKRLTGTNRADYLRICRRGLFLAGIAAAPAAAVMAGHGWSPHTPLAQIIPACAVGGLFWLAALRSLRHPLFDELQRLLGKLRASRVTAAPPV